MILDELSAGSPVRRQGPGPRSGDLFSYKMERLAGCRRGLVNMRKREGEALLVCICDSKLTQPLLCCPGVRCSPARCSLLYPAAHCQYESSLTLYFPSTHLYSECELVFAVMYTLTQHKLKNQNS